jgi:hypothetical protein
MIHIIYIYLIINSFILGWHLRESRFESLSYKVISFSVLIFFGAIILPLIYILPVLAKIIGWVVREVRFNYRFYCTKYWDKVLLDDNYSEEYKTREEKLKRANQITKNASKQFKRHNRLIQKKYGRHN